MVALKYAGLHAVALLTALGFLLGGPWMWTGIVIIFALAAVADEVLGEDHGPARDQKSWLYEVLLWITPFVQSIVVVCLALQVDLCNLGIYRRRCVGRWFYFWWFGVGRWARTHPPSPQQMGKICWYIVVCGNV